VHGVPRRCLIAVHGVGLDADGLAALAPWLRAVVLCPSSNAYLLGAAPPYALLEAAGVPVALGSDSRLTAAGDLLDEMRFACGQGIAPAALARWQAEGRALLGVPPPFAPDTPADFLLLPAYVPLHQARRGDLALVVRGGIAQWGQPHLLRAFGVAGVPAALDGGRIALHPALAARIRRSMIAEPGLSLGARQPG
jgi:cytosine/adenosine deaminase-related metal-dependent hydrolase